VRQVVIVDYGMCNLDSVARAVEECGGSPRVSDRPEDLALATHVVLPGVGALPDAVRNLAERKLDLGLREHVLERRIPFLGICLGMQLLATRGSEGGGAVGLGWIEGDVPRLTPAGEDTRIPHIGWNEVHPTRESPLFRGIEPGRDFYFVHSYHLRPGRPGDVLATTPYAGGFVSAVQRDQVFGVQFHPEKSQRAGFQVLRNFLSL
jgi:glutamine amidotransferase